MKYTWVLAFGALILLFLLAGCNLGTPICQDNNLQQPILGAPQDGTITNNLTPVLSWSYPDQGCHPVKYHIDLNSLENAPVDYSGETNGTSTTWGPSTPLLPGKEYEWAVWSANGAVYGIQSPFNYFFTGPMCDTTALQAPALLVPGDGELIHHRLPELLWQYPQACLPEGYRVDLSTDPSFTDTSLSGGTGNPSVVWGPAQELADCATYFWRVAPINGTSLGPFSTVNTFRIDESGECAPEATAAVRGMLWYDQCSVPLDASPAPDPLPTGCAVDSYGVDADGIHQPGEPPILNVTVHLGPGDCPSGGPMGVVTNINGMYTISGLTPGKYCLNVDAASFLGPGGTGHWTLIPSGHEGNTYRSILLSAGETLAGQDFAWYQYAGAGATPTPTPAQGSSFAPGLNANCRSGPDKIFPVLDVAMKGRSYPIDGRNLDASWLRIMLAPGRGCWVPSNTGTSSADLSGVRVLISPPTPTPTTVAAALDCSSYKDQKSCQAHPACQWKLSPSTAAAIYHCASK